MRYSRIFSILTITDLGFALASPESVEILHFGRSEILGRDVDSGIDNRLMNQLYHREALSEADQFSSVHLLIPRALRPPPRGNTHPPQKPGTPPPPLARGNTPPPTRSGTPPPPPPPNAEAPTLSSLPRANTWPLRDRAPQVPVPHSPTTPRLDRSMSGTTPPNTPTYIVRSNTPSRANTPPLPGHNTPSSQGNSQQLSRASSAASRAGSNPGTNTPSHAGTSAFSSEAESHPPSRATSSASGASTPPRTRTPSPQRIPLPNARTPPNQGIPLSAPWAPRRNVMRALEPGQLPWQAWPNEGQQHRLPDWWPSHR